MNTGGRRFANISTASGIDFPDDGRAVGVVDWDQDGDLDLWMTNRNGPQIRLLRNDIGTDRSYVSVRLVGRTCNRDAIGARVEVMIKSSDSEQAMVKLIKTLRAGNAYISQSSKWLHFGLGGAKEIERAMVHWPDGKSEEFTGLQLNGRYRLEQDTGKAKSWLTTLRKLDVQPMRLDSHSTRQAARTHLARRFPLPPLSYSTSTGESGEVHDLKGRPLLLNLWASWCLPCVKELSDLVEHQDECREQELQILALSVDELGDTRTHPDSARQILENLEFPFASGTASDALVDKLQLVQDELFNVSRPLPLPSSLLIDPQGRLTVLYKGPLDMRQLIDDVRQLDLSENDRRDVSVPFPGRWFEPLTHYRLLLTAAELLKQGYLEDAMRYVDDNQRLMINDPDLAGFLVDIGNALVQHNRVDDALLYFQRALDLKSEFAPANYFYAVALEGVGQLDLAIEHYRRALQADSELVNVHRRLAALLASQNQPHRALEHFREVTRLSPNSAEEHHNLAVILESVGEHRQAIEKYRRAIEIDSLFIAAQNNLAWILATHPDPQIRDGQQAVSWAENVCKAGAYQSSTALDTLAAAYAEAGRIEDAIRIASKAVQLARDAEQSELVEEIQARLELFEQGEAYHTKQDHHVLD